MPAHGFDEWFTATGTDVAALLDALSTEVGDGTVTLGRTDVDVPDEIAVELAYERDGTEHELEIELSWDDDGRDDSGDDESGEGELEFGKPARPSE